jgi:SAM-dependent methyltransferase
MLSAQDLDRFAREYYLSDDIADHGIENTLQRASAPRILGQLAPGERVLEMGYGDGLLTADLVGRGVALDLLEGSPLLCQEATRRYGDKIAVHCGLFEEFAAGPVYDTVLALHVIEHVSEPITTLREIARWLKPGGKLILVEGFTDGFDALNELRRKCDLPDLVPAAINFYSSLARFTPIIERWFTVAGEFHTGMFDFLTRVVYPRLVGPDQVGASDDFHRKIDIVARQYNPAAMQPLGRVRGFALVKRAG